MFDSFAHLVPHGVAVVWRREDGDALPPVRLLVPGVLDLVRPHHVVEAVLGQEGVRHVRAELETVCDQEGFRRKCANKLAKQN